MNHLQNYKNDNISGLSRIDTLLEIYDCAISSFQQAKMAMAKQDDGAFVQNFLKGQKAILAIHSGLKPDEHDVAFNVARLLHFVLQKIEDRNFDDALAVLTSLRSGFAAIQDEANQLEKSGQIPKVPQSDAFAVQA